MFGDPDSAPWNQPADGSTDTPDVKRDTSATVISGGDASGPYSGDAAVPPADFQGIWDPLPGLEGYPIWKARDAAASVSPLRWGPCTPALAGCEEIINDWSSTPGTHLQNFSDTSFYKEGGRAYFIYDRTFADPAHFGVGGFRSIQTVVEEMGAGPKIAIGQTVPRTTHPSISFGGGALGISSSGLDDGSRNLREYAYDIATGNLTRRVFDLVPLAIPRDDVGMAWNYGTHFSHASGTTPLLTLSDLSANTLFAATERHDWVSQQLRADGLFAVNQGLNTLDFITYAGVAHRVYTPAAGMEVYSPAFDRDSNTLVWFESSPANMGSISLYASPASSTALTPRLVRHFDLGDVAAYNSNPVVHGDYVAYGVSPATMGLYDVTQISTGVTHRVRVPSGYLGDFAAKYVDANTIWAFALDRDKDPTSMIKLNYLSSPVVP